MVISDLLNIKKYIVNYNYERNHNIPINTIILNENINRRFMFHESQLVDNKIHTFHGYKFDDFYINFDCEIFAAIVIGVSIVVFIKKYN